MASEPVPIQLGTVVAQTPVAAVRRFVLILWGKSGCGKTTLAATAPGPILWLCIDDEGTACLSECPQDIIVIDLAKEPDNVVEKFKNPNPMGIEKVLKEHPEIKTVVFDSATTFRNKALAHGVVVAQGTTKGRSSTLEDPGYAGYGNLNTWMQLMVKNLVAATGKYERNFILIAHEDKPERDNQGNVLSISMMLGSSLNEQVPVNVGEVWNLNDTGQKHMLAIRPVALRKPVKTRMFKTTGEPQFEWKFDPDKWEGGKIEDWIEAWKENEFRKIELPK